jgi:methylated-DNA-[protein]-cysteine S-methyltransferase
MERMNEIETALREAASTLEGPPPELALGFAERAGEEGLVDVAYAPVDSPLGPITLAGTVRGLALVSYGPPEGVVERLAERISPRVLEAPARLDEARRELDEYFEGRRREFALPLDWSLTRDGFGRRVLKATAEIPFGEVSTYRGVATEAGNARAVRAAGNALGANPLPVVVPCHRVLRTGGGLGGYTGGVEKKEELLRLEGVLP